MVRFHALHDLILCHIRFHAQQTCCNDPDLSSPCDLRHTLCTANAPLVVSMQPSPLNSPPYDVHGLAVIGAGPAALAVLLRLSRATRDECSSPATRDTALRLLHSTIVIDASGGWLALWRRKLGSQGVSHLRSPTFVHPHASRLVDDAVLAFATSHHRLHELHPLPEATPHNAPKAWHAPSAALFDDFCAAALDELHDTDPTLMDRLLLARVADIVPLSGGGCELHLEQVAATASSSVASPPPTLLLARRVLLAVCHTGL